MSFTFHWPRFSDQFHYDAIQMLNTALNKGNKPPIIADKIEVVELEMGTQPPELEIRDIGDLTMDQFRGIFRLTYAGDAHLVLKTKVQANPLNHKQPDIHLMAGSRGMLAAKQALVVPMLLRLSHFKLSSYVVLVVSKQKGITLVFKTDPLQSVDINSTFDSIAVIQNFIQREIEGQLRQMFREDLPGIIHRLSQQWVKAKVEPPPPTPTGLTQRNVGALNAATRVLNSAPPSLTRHNINVFNSSASALPSFPRPGSISRTNVTRRSFARSSPPVPPTPSPLDNDVEPPFDPTYGLRPDGIPAKGVFRGFKSLFAPTRGLAELAETEQESSVISDDFETTYDVLEWGQPPFSSASMAEDSEYERMPAVGGGTILRPRIIHSQSQPVPQSQSHAPPSTVTAPTRPELSHNPFSAAFAAPSSTSSRSTSPSPSHSPLSLSTPPSSTSYHEPQPLTVQSIHTLAMLSHSNHTLSPYTRSLSHFAVRSGPPRPPVVGAPAIARKGKRRRTFRINGGSAKSPPPPPADVEETHLPQGHPHAFYPDDLSPAMSPSRSDFDVRDMDKYFRHMDMDGDSRGEHSASPKLRPSAHAPLRHKVSSLAMSATASRT
ncbi:mitochondrial distribution and morphology protein 34 [Favolaschia claudopus]|uniref:Mitochondrial distribution and morphology protein 34 n=1 Tax=Favolaschia claudopus TaxID=2862362 RepID=A0AAW0ECR4_9AGAR